MPLTIQQDRKYWREWGQACRAQGWRGREADARRKEWHAKLKLPESHTHWTHQQFSRWISGTAHLRDAVDIADRERQSVEWTICRLREAFVLVLGRDYAASIMADWRDSDDTADFPTSDPADHPRQQNGRLDPRDAGKLRDLEQLRNTLKNRLGRVIQRIRDGEMQAGPDCPDFGDASQADIISALIARRPIAPRVPRSSAAEPAPSRTPTVRYRLGQKNHFPPPVQQSPSKMPAPHAYCTHDDTIYP